MHNFTYKRADLYRKRWLEAISRCNALFSRYNELCVSIRDYENKNGWNCEDMTCYKALIDDRLLCEADLVEARVECRRSWREYYQEFPFLAAFENLGGDTY